VDRDGNYIITQAGDSSGSTFARLLKINRDSGAVTTIYEFDRYAYPFGVAVDSDGNYIVTETTNDILSKIMSNGQREIIFQFAPGTWPCGIDIDSAGNYIVTEYSTRTISKISPVHPVNRPPVIQSLTADPSQLWPPNNKPADVTINVQATDPDGSGDITRITYSVNDEYDKYNVAETDLPSNGVISLIAARNGQDKDGRVYAITIKVYDAGGLSSTSSVNVIVPHDQGKK
jgi:hypothetical protein